MSRIPFPITKRQIKVFEKNGFKFKRILGIHHYYVNEANGKIMVVPTPLKSFPKGTITAILSQAGINKADK